MESMILAMHKSRNVPLHMYSNDRVWTSPTLFVHSL
jgi:hypothetical protein